MTQPVFSQFANLRKIAPYVTAPRTPTGRSKRAKGPAESRWTIEQTLQEACRVPSACKHVAHPLPPVWLVGSGSQVRERAGAWHAQARQSNGKAWPKTSPSLASAVISFPRERAKDWPAYRDDALAFFSATYGSRVVGAVEHLDEAHPHVHIYLVPLPGEEFGAVDPGYAASRAERKADNKVGTAWRAAMTKWQDKLHQGFGQRHGLARFGPRRARLSRNEWRLLDASDKKAKKRLDAAALEAESLLAVARREAQAIRAAAERERADLSAREPRVAKVEQQQAQRKRELVVLAQAIDQRQQQLNAMPQAQLLAQREADRGALELLKKELDEVRFRLSAHEERVARERGSFVPVLSPTPFRPMP